ncbi:phosphotransferase family protein [Glycomyces arizonensis]|uniref:phosphotransferase family protein n=1 Tax=Glycomyces arizonensis TaxID=256035 RepID=UPI0004037F69|nr:aminoglycoside phosphotransferase family protein [Glycomyces arizonensis]
MDIAIRPQLSRADVEALVRDRLGGDLQVVAHEEFKDGFFNAAHAVTLADGRDLVVKVAPDPELKLLRYEVDLMATEIECFERAGAAGVPMPRLWHTDAVGGVMIMDRLKGISLPKAKERMSGPELLALRREIGALSARLNTADGERFGYPRKSGRTGSDSWAASFMAMMDDLLADADEFDAPLPRPAAEIRRIVAAHRPLLDAVERPALVHFDLWDGNIFVEPGESGWRVEGFIDGERAFYGDALAELVSLLFVSDEEAAAVIDGFLGRELTDDERRRLSLYQVYLWLILITECEVRGFEPEQTAAQRSWATENLVRDLAFLESQRL